MSRHLSCDGLHFALHRCSLQDEEREAEHNQDHTAIPEYRLTAFVYHGPLVSKACVYNARQWLLDVDDD